MFLFFIAGFETTALTLCYCLYELALHVDIQNELRAEIIREKTEHDGKITYDALKKMTLLDMVISGQLVWNNIRPFDVSKN